MIKPQQLCYIVRTDNISIENTGKVVETVEYYGLWTGKRAWRCRCSTPVKCWTDDGTGIRPDKFTFETSFIVYECHLHPINDPGLPPDAEPIDIPLSNLSAQDA